MVLGWANSVSAIFASSGGSQLEKLSDVHLQAGTPAETLIIITGERAMLEYLTQPIRDSFRSTFR
jgi:HlyD family secretion protein